MKAIPTEYKEIKYRSRLEAKWAYFFDKIGFITQYEPFTITSNGLSYTPDFFCHAGVRSGNIRSVLIEIKPKKPNAAYLRYLEKIHCPGKSDILICVGSPNMNQPDGILIKTDLQGQSRIEHGFTSVRCPHCQEYTITPISFTDEYGGYYDCMNLPHVSTKENEYTAEKARHRRFDL